jgi:hypothetical protein
MEQFIKNILNGKKRKSSVIDQLYTRPKKDVDGDNPTFPHIDKNYSHQMDLLYLPNDNGYKYCLVVVDQGSRLLDCIELEDRTSGDIASALKQLYAKSKYLSKPFIVVTDAGKEFLGDFDYELKKIGIKHHKVVKSGRHRMVSLAERKNQTIGKIVHKILNQVQLTSGNPSSKWVSFLKPIVKAINNKVVTQMKKQVTKLQPITYNPDHKIDLLNEGDRVRVALDNPRDVDGKQLNGRFRTGDIRFDPKIRTIKNVYSKPNQPIMYFLDGKSGKLDIEPVGYTRNQLLLVTERDENNELPLFENEPDRFEVQKILDKGTDEAGDIFYLVKFKGQRKSKWIDRDSLINDLGKNYMKKIDKKFDK